MLKKLNMVVSVLALLALTLAGCKNGMLGENEVTVNGQRGVGGRSVKVIITNFVGNGMSRTIAPDQLTGDQLQTDHVLVATGTSGRKTMPPTIVNVTVTGQVDFTGLEAGVWTLTITAYNKGKLGGANHANATEVAAVDAAKVLSGTAAVDLTSSNGEAKITLTPREITGNGTVNLAVKFDQNDVTTVTGNQNYKVKIGLYDKLSGKVVTIGGGQQSTEVDNVTPNSNPGVTYDANSTNIPKGVYLFKVEIRYENQQNTNDKRGPWQYSDEIYIEGNTATTGTVDLPQLIGVKPTTPEKLAVYWDSATGTDPNNLTWTAKFAWDRKSYNEKAFELEIADLTGKYTITSATGGTYSAAVGAGQTVTSDTDLWTQHIETANDKATFVTTLKFEDFNRNNYPIYKGGSLLAGNTKVEYELPAGRVYAARIRAYNSDGASDWAYLGTVAPANPYTGIEQLTKSGFVFDVLTLTYDLEGKYLLLKEQETNDKAVKGKNVQFAEYGFGQEIEIEYKVDNLPPGTAGGYLLYPENHADGGDRADNKHFAWTGWRDVTVNNPTQDQIYGVNKGYDGSSSVTLVPTGVQGGSSSGQVDVQNSGTYAKELNEDTLLISAAGAKPTSWTDAEKLSSATDDVSAGTRGQKNGLGKIGAAQTYGLNMEPAPQGGTLPEQKIFFAVGEKVDEGDGNGTSADIKPNKLQLNDAIDGATKRVGTVVGATYTLEKKGSNYKKSVTSPYGTSEAEMNVTGEATGDYVLRVEIKFDSGWTSTYQIPFILKYTDDPEIQ